MKDKLTKKQKDVFEIICTYIDKNKISPTIRELMDMVGYGWIKIYFHYA